jgi:diacylglycerol kinase (ATP)
MAVIVGLIIATGDEQWERIRLAVASDSLGRPFMVRLVAGAFLVGIAVVIGKGLGRHGRILQGGKVSGHAAYGFFLATCVFFAADNVIVGAIAILLAAIIAQSRYEARFHSIFELTLGALVGSVIGVLIFGVLPK